MKLVFALTFGMILAIMFWGLWATAAQGHSWYDPSCCSTIDCAPVAEGVVEDAPDGGINVKGYGHLSATDPRVRWSRDHQDHLCISGSKKLLCVYRKPKGT